MILHFMQRASDFAPTEFSVCRCGRPDVVVVSNGTAAHTGSGHVKIPHPFSPFSHQESHYLHGFAA